MSQFVIDSVAVTVRDTATNETLEYRGTLGAVSDKVGRASAREKPVRPAPAGSKPGPEDSKAPARKAAARKLEASPPRDESPKAKKAAGPRTQPELKWSPIQDGKYHGFGAAS